MGVVERFLPNLFQAANAFRVTWSERNSEGVSRAFISDTSPKWIDRELKSWENAAQGLGKRGSSVILKTPIWMANDAAVPWKDRKKRHVGFLNDAISLVFRASWSSPYLVSFFRIISWSLVSKAFFKSMKITPLRTPLSILTHQLSFVCNKAAREACS